MQIDGNLFLINVHYIPKPEIRADDDGARAIYLPSIRPLEGQRALALANPELFLSVVSSIPTKATQDGKICASVLKGKPCRDSSCQKAGSLAELYAVNMAKNIRYKTVSCNNTHPHAAIHCLFKHENDIPRSSIQSKNLK